MADHAHEEQTSHAEQSPTHEPVHAEQRSPQAAAAWQAYVGGLNKGKEDDLADLTASQKPYIENLRAIEKANPKATPQDIAMALSMVLWEGRIWERDGKAADVTRPAGAPLVLDYAGGKGYQDVKLSPENEQAIRTQREVHDKHGRESGVAHAFPAVAAQAGRQGTMAGDYNAYMVSKGGDLIQDVAQIIVEQKLDGTFRDAEARDNQRAVEIGKEAGGGEALSVLLCRHFRRENAEKLGLDV